MKYFVAVFFLASILTFSACLDTPEDPLVVFQRQLQQDLEEIDEFLADNGIVAQATPDSSLRFVIQDAGVGESPVDTDLIDVAFEGRFFNGQVFDMSDSVRFPLNGLIDGWRIGVPLISEGGSITLYIPSGLAFGANGTGDGSIPPNSNVVFDIDLLNVVE